MSLDFEGQGRFFGPALCLYYKTDFGHVKQNCLGSPKSAYNYTNRSSKKISNWEWIWPQSWR